MTFKEFKIEVNYSVLAGCDAEFMETPTHFKAICKFGTTPINIYYFMEGDENRPKTKWMACHGTATPPERNAETLHDALEILKADCANKIQDAQSIFKLLGGTPPPQTVDESIRNLRIAFHKAARGITINQINALGNALQRETNGAWFHGSRWIVEVRRPD